MSQAKHTPGPWYLKQFDTFISIDAPTPEGSKDVCDIQGVSDEDKANARLIAAAPDMLSTLKFILEDGNSTLDYEARLIIEATISKAEGRA